MKQERSAAAPLKKGVPAVVATPCAACKLLRRRCSKDECAFAPYFPAEDPVKFATVHRVFGASNVNKMLQDLPAQHRGDAVSSLVYEANARVRDPVYGCVGAISALQQQIHVLQAQLALTQAEVLHLRSLSASQAAAALRKTGDVITSPTAAVHHPHGSALVPSSTSSLPASKLAASDTAKSSFLAADRSWW
uniref:LOB domain-containing protein n=1 Tax=Kalanchoe fedtschenkoi TaxID=63787 RepID=A0A7N0VEZ1_KALFE